MEAGRLPTRVQTDSRLRVGDIDINHRLEGRSDAPIVMLCHGLLGNLHLWDPQLRALSRQYRVLRWDNRGHGLSDTGRLPYTMELLCRDTVALMDALKIERAHFVGCSLGGMIGQRLAARHADRLASLVLVGTLSVMGPASLWDERVRTARARGIAPLLPVMLDRWFTPAFRARRPQVVAAVARGVLATPVQGFVGACQAIRSMNQTALLARIRTPTLVMGADHDPGVPRASTRALHAAIAGSELCMVRAARHLLSVEHPRVFTRTLLSWLARH